MKKDNVVSQEQLLSFGELCDFLNINKERAKFLRYKTDMPRLKLGRNYYYLMSSVMSWLHSMEDQAMKERDKISQG